jgi:preprotein translocase subunit SecF
MSLWSNLRNFEPRFDFVRWRFINFAVSAAMLIGAIIAVATIGLNYGLDFTGGLAIEARSPNPVDLGSLRSELAALPIGETKLQGMEDARDVLIRVQLAQHDEKAQQEAIALIKQKLGGEFEFRQVEIIGPTVGAELLRNGILASVLAAVGIGGYVAFRFEWRFGVSALLRTIHELMVTVGFFALLDLEFNLTAIAALLALAGYSINDTVVVFDRLRENRRKYKRMALVDMINLSTNQIATRTTLVSAATALSVIPLLFGGPVLLNFSVAILFGIVVGTFSSTYVAAMLLLYLPAVGGNVESKAEEATA